MLRTQKLGEADRIVTLLTRARPGPGGGQGGAPHQVQVRLPARAVHPRRRAALRRPLAGHRHPGRDARRPTARRSSPTTPRYTAGTAMLETAERLTAEEREPAIQQFLLLVGGLRSLADGDHDPRPGARRLPAALAGGGRLGAGVQRLRPLRRARPAPGVRRPAAGGSVCPQCRPPGSAAPHPQTLELLAALLAGDWDDGRRQRAARAGGRQRPGRRLPAVAPGARAALAAAGGALMSAAPPIGRIGPGCGRRDRPGHRRRRTRPAPGRPPSRAELVPRHVAMVMDGNGRWAKRAGCPAPRGTRPARPRCSTWSRARSRSASRTCRRTRSRPRTGGARRTRCGS